MNLFFRLKNNPDHLINGVIGLVFVIAGLSILLLFGTRSTLTCNRSQPPAGVCTLRTDGVLGQKEKQYPISQLRGATVEESTGEDGSTYRVVLLTASGDVPFTSFYSSGSSGKEKIASQINAFLQDPSQQGLLLKADSRIFMAIFAGIFAGVGALLLISTLRKLLNPEVEAETGLA